MGAEYPSMATSNGARETWNPVLSTWRCGLVTKTSTRGALPHYSSVLNKEKHVQFLRTGII